MSNNNQQLPSSLELRENYQGNYKSIFAGEDLVADTILITFGHETIVSTPNRYTIQRSDDEHIFLNPIDLQYINHSCNPNVFFDTQNMELRTLKDIKKGTEISFFYPSTEWKMTEAFDCVCKSDNCLKRIGGASLLSKKVLQQYRLSHHINQKIK